MIVFFSGNLIAYIFYHFKFRIIERERVNPDVAWPWESDPEEWPKLFRRSIFFNLLNSFIVNPLMLLPLYLSSHKIEHNMSHEMPKPHIFFL
jgi:hypothetical protein